MPDTVIVTGVRAGDFALAELLARAGVKDLVVTRITHNDHRITLSANRLTTANEKTAILAALAKFNESRIEDAPADWRPETKDRALKGVIP